MITGSTNSLRTQRHSLLALLAIVCILFGAASCASGRAESIDPTKAVTQLAPLPRRAQTPTAGVYYCIFVRSFADSNGDGIGDFKGMTARLDYLNDGNDRTTSDLGVTGIWLLPIFPSQSYHGYNVDDYYGVNPDYGTLADFEEFLSEAEKRGISVIIDMTCNHSSLYTDWFIESRNKDSPYRGWYRWVEDGDTRYNLNQKIWGHNLWNYYEGAYYAGLFESGMPDFNLSNPAVREEFKNIASYWIGKGVDGFRFDAAGHVFNAAKLAAGEESQSQGVAFWKELVGHVRSVKPDAYTVGEVWEPTSTRAVYMQGLGSTFHFDLGTKIVDAIREGSGGKNNIANSLYGDYATYKEMNPDYIDAPFLTNHDQNRISGMLRGDSRLLKLSASLYILAEGVPFMYYGEEIGLMGAKPDEQIRTPMLWNDPGKDRLQTSWIESKYNKNTIPVSRQQKDPESLLNYYKRLIRVKTAHSALFEGRFTAVATDASEIVSWKMESQKEKAFVLHNLSPKPVTLVLPPEALGADGARMPLIFAGSSGVTITGTSITLPPRESAVLAAASAQ